MSRHTGTTETWYSGVFREMEFRRAAMGLALSLLITFLLPRYQFRSIPEYQLGDIADRTIKAPDAFTVSDEQATAAKRQENLRNVPAVFDLDLRRNGRIQSELRSGFGHARGVISGYVDRLNLGASDPLPLEVRQQLISQLKTDLPSFNRGDALQVLLKTGFSAELEDQMVRLLQQAMRPPGVVSTRDQLAIYQERGIVLYNTITRREEALKDWVAIRDLEQARNLLRQNEFELTVVSGREKREIIDFLDNWIVENVIFNEADTQQREQMAMEEVAPVLIQIKKGRTIVRAGDEVTAQALAILAELKQLEQSREPADRFIGLFLLVGFLMFALQKFLAVYWRRYQKMRAPYLLVGLILFLNLGLTKLLVMLADLVAGSFTAEYLQNPLHFYFMIPMAVGAVLMVLLVDAQLSILYSLTFAVLVALLTGQVSMGIYPLAGSLTATYMLRQYRERSAMVHAGLVIGIVNALTAFSLQLYSTGFHLGIFGIRVVGAFLAGLFAVMLASLLLPVLEWAFQITTDIRLLELSNLNKPMLRRLALEAPGTYHHSIIVGTLAEAAAEAIGANSLLARVGAYYHDIGKLRKPDYYAENQIYMANKHEGLTPSMSSLILASHVKDGLVLAKEIKLAPIVRDLIPEHHGTKLMTFFYQKAKQGAESKNNEVNEEDFRYPGPKPQTREAAILMLADQVEAASRTLQDPTPGQIRGLIRRLIQATIQDRQFDECDITTKDLDKITRAFERVITGMYHHRIEYPGFNFNKEVAERRPPNQRIQ